MEKIFRKMVGIIPRKYLIKLSYIFNKIAPLVYLGNNVYCPICRTHFRKFLPYGKSWRDNRMCPKCFSLERHRLIWHYLQNETEFFSRKLKVLHIAPEQCFFHKFKKQKNIDYLTADLESPLADVKMDIIDIPFKDDYFDVVICNHVLEHIPDDQRAMTELYRVLKKDGFAILQIPLDASRQTTLEDEDIVTTEQRKEKYWASDHLRLYGLDYPDRLEKAGFKMQSIRYAEKLNDEMINKERLLADLLLFIGRK